MLIVISDNIRFFLWLKVIKKSEGKQWKVVTFLEYYLNVSQVRSPPMQNNSLHSLVCCYLN